VKLELDGGGSLAWQEDALRVRLEVRRKDDGRGLYKAFVSGREGELPLGTLLPEQGALTLRRTLSLDALRRQGCWPITGGRCALAFSFQEPPKPSALWSLRRDCAGLLADPILQASARGWGGFLWRPEGEGFALAAPLEHHRPFPLPPLFCLGRVEEIQGRTHVIWRFDREGNPLLPA
jgi:hypothetical protein